jgi:glutathionyl-hydroquinone reductase
MRYLYWNIPAFKDTTEFTHIKAHYTKSHTRKFDPFGVIIFSVDAFTQRFG